MDDFQFPKTLNSSGNIQTTILITPELYKLAKEQNIEFTESFRIGINLRLADKGLQEYDSELVLMKKIELLRQKLETTSNELESLKLEKQTKKLEILDKEAEEFFEKIEEVEIKNKEEK